MGLECTGVRFKLLRNGVAVGEGSADMTPGGYKRALIKAVEEYAETDQFKRDTYRLYQSFTIQVQCSFDTAMPTDF